MPFLSFRTSEFHPLTLTMRIENMLYGITSLHARWETAIQSNTIPSNRWIEPTVLPDSSIIEAIKSLSVNQVLRKGDIILAAHLDDLRHGKMMKKQSIDILDELDAVTYDHSCERIDSLQYMIDHNKDQIIKDWETDEKSINWSRPSPYKNTFVVPDVHLTDVIIDDRQGPVIIHKGVTILPGAKIMGPIVLLPDAVVKMGVELYPGSTIGSHTTVSGEIKNTIIHEYSAKGHAGYLGDSILGRWNNFGAGTTVSNVANTFSQVRIEDWSTGQKVTYDAIKRGLVTGDFVKLGILTKVYRGTSIGSFSSIATGKAIKGNIPALTWWTEDQRICYQTNQLREHCQRQMALYQQSWTDEWENMLSRLSVISENTEKRDVQ